MKFNMKHVSSTPESYKRDEVCTLHPGLWGSPGQTFIIHVGSRQNMMDMDTKRAACSFAEFLFKMYFLESWEDYCRPFRPGYAHAIIVACLDESP